MSDNKTREELNTYDFDTLVNLVVTLQYRLSDKEKSEQKLKEIYKIHYSINKLLSIWDDYGAINRWVVFEFAVDMLVCIVEEKLLLEIRVFKHKTD